MLPHKWLIIAIVWELVLIAVLLQIGAVRDAFGITMPGWSDVGFVLALGAGVLVSVEIVKFVLRRRTLQAEAQPDRAWETPREATGRSGAE